jgi:hypothetical protein
MKNITRSQIASTFDSRRGSTLVIVIALLGLLAFVGMLFYSFAAQERAASENFSDAAKYAVDEPPNVFDHMLRQVIIGPGNQPSERTSILRSPEKRHSLVTNMVGNDIYPHTGEGVNVANIANLPAVDQNGDGIADGNDWLDFVDSPVARSVQGYVERDQEAAPNIPPTPDVDYTYPDINNLFLAYKGWAIRDNTPAPPGTPRYERVPVIIPSFFRPQYMKLVINNGPSGSNVPTDRNWASAFDGTNRGTALFSARSFRPNPLHIAGRMPDGTRVFRFLTDFEATGLGLTAGFPFLPADDINSGNGTAARGELGVWTGSHPGVYELDADNDGDLINEGIWLDLNYPVQETATGKLYVILHSVTIYDLDALIDVNVHGNLAGLNRIGNIKDNTVQPNATALVRDGLMSTQFLSRSNLGLGPNEINPLWALRRGQPPGGHPSLAQFTSHFGRAPGNDLEQANMEWLWLLSGRGEFTGTTLDNLLPGRWGETERLYNAINGGGTFRVEDLPRPGRSGNAQQSGTSGIRFGGSYTSAGRNGFDDNQDRYEGEADASQGRLRAFGHPHDYAGTGRTHTGTFGNYDGITSSFAAVAGSPRQPLLHHDGASAGPERWLRYLGYSANRSMNDTVPRYMFGQNETFEPGTTPSDDLISDPFYDALFEDPLETIFDVEFAQRQFDQIFSPSDLLGLHLTPADKASAPDQITERLTELAPFGFENVLGNDVRDRFTTISNSLRRFMIKHDLGRDLLLGTGDDGPRAWEFSADTDGADRNGDGYGEEGDGRREFPPAFGVTPANGLPYSATDPFRPQVRRLLTVEAGESRELVGQLPLSINHILDVERNAQTPDELSQPVQFLRYMQRAGLRFRPLTEHPSAEIDNSILTLASIPTWTPGNPVLFPPTTPGEREFWARRDRQKLARDIYVLLYTIGGARRNGATINIKNYTGSNNPALGESDTTAPALYTHEQLRRMAQFAVNMVDAMDTDNVITKFEYDKNLGNGWGMDDDPYTADFSIGNTGDADYVAVTANGLYPEDQTTNGAAIPERGVVYGVEAQEIAFSEVLGIQSPDIMEHVATPFSDQGSKHNFMFVEIQNMSPTQHRLATPQSNVAATAIWRLARYDRKSGTTARIGLPSAPDNGIAFLNHPDNVIQGGGRFSISATGDTGLASSAFFIDTGDPTSGNFDGTFELIAPNATGVTLPTSPNAAGSSDPGYSNPLTDLDIIHSSHASGHFAPLSGNFLATPAIGVYGGNDVFNLPIDALDRNAGTGDFVTSTNEGFDLVLQRRANPNLPTLNTTDNPWVEVDRTLLLMKPFPLATGDTADQVYTPAAGATLASGHLINLASVERREPLDDGSRQPSVASPVAYRLNTIKGDLAAASNDTLGINAANATVPFQLWQQHLDRDFASPGELLDIPIIGPNLLTQRLERMKYSPYQQAFSDPKNPPAPSIGSTKLDPNFLSGAAALILRPDFPNLNSALDTTDLARDNRWYRLFQFVEVPSRVHRMLGNYVSLDRVPGKLNLNTIRHWEVYAGIVDNPILMDRESNPIVSGRFTHDRTPDNMGNQNPIGNPVDRDRWLQFLQARDGGAVSGFDPRPSINNIRSFWLPGTPNARPFHSPGFTRRNPNGAYANGADASGADATIFRIGVADVDDGDERTNRNWLEVGDVDQHKIPGTTNTVHQHQLLSKIMNNSTTVSNTFIVYSTAAYFEAIEDPPNSGFIRVGARMDLEPNAGPPTNPGWQQRAVFIIDRTEAFEAYDPGSGDFDWKKLVKARATIE